MLLASLTRDLFNEQARCRQNVQKNMVNFPSFKAARSYRSSFLERGYLFKVVATSACLQRVDFLSLLLLYNFRLGWKTISGDEDVEEKPIKQRIFNYL